MSNEKTKEQIEREAILPLTDQEKLIALLKEIDCYLEKKAVETLKNSAQG